MLVSNPAITAALSTSNNAIKIINSKMQIDDGSSAYKILKASFDTNNLNQVFEKYIQTKEFNLLNDVSQDQKNLFQHSFELDKDGNTVHNISFNTDFKIKENNSQHISLFLMCSIDMELLVNDYNLSYDNLTLGYHNGKITSEIVIDNGITIGTSNIFLMSDKTPWYGPVNENGQGNWFTGYKYSAETSKPLALLKVPNNKIQDFRIIEFLARKMINLSSIENDIINPSNKFIYLKSGGEIRKPKNVYFSEAFISKSRDGNSRFMFALDYQRMLKENSIFENLFLRGTRSQIKNILKKCKIKDIKIKRRRITPIRTMNKNGNYVDGYVPFDLDAPYDIITYSADSELGRINSMILDTGEISEGDIGLSLDSTLKDVRFFKVTDKTISKVTDGYYQYGLDISIEDASQKFVYELIDKLKRDKARLYQYYLKASEIGINNLISEADDPHIEETKEKLNILKNNQISNFNIDLGRFTNKFIEEQYSLYPNNAALKNAPWISPIINYLEILNLFTGVLTEQEDLQSLLKLADPYSGSPKGIETVIKLIDNFLSKTATIIGYDIALGNDENSLMKENSLSSPPRIINISHWFTDHYIDSNFNKEYGLDYLTINPSDIPDYQGMRFITGQYYYDRVLSEMRNFFIDENISLDIEGITTGDSYLRTGWTYLSPSLIAPSLMNTSELRPVNIPNIGNTILGTINPNNLPISIIGQSEPSFFASLESTIIRNASNPFRIPDPNSAVPRPRPEDILEQELRTNLSQSGIIINQGNVGQQRPVFTPQDVLLPNECLLDRKEKNLDPIIDIHTENLYRDIAVPSTLSRNQAVLRDRAQNQNLNPIMLEFLSITRQYYNNRNESNSLLIARNIVNNQQVDSSNILELPNSFKGILLSLTNPDMLKPIFRWFDPQFITNQEGNEININSLYSPMYLFFYHLTNKIEVLKDFDGNLKSSKWQNLTYETWQNSIGKELLCRMKPYSNNILRINRPNHLDNLSIYDEYFILKAFSLTGSSIDIGEIDLERIVIENNQLNIDRIGVNMPIGITVTNVISSESTSSTYQCDQFTSDISGVNLIETDINSGRTVSNDIGVILRWR